MRLVDHPEVIASWPEPTADAPWRILVSGCLGGLPCGVGGDDYGLGSHTSALASAQTAKIITFCPEDFSLGTPRTMPDIHGGDGFDVLDGRARVLDEHGRDLTHAMIAGAEQMLVVGRRENVRFALLTDMSAACGSQVIALGCRFDEPRQFQRGAGVAAATLARAHLPVVSQRDHATLRRIYERLRIEAPPFPTDVDHHDSDWVRANLPSPRRWPVQPA